MDSSDAGLLDVCADAVLVLSDGATVRCSRFVMSQKCSVLRFVAEEGMATATFHGKYVIPVPDVGREKYEAFVGVLHGAARAEDLDHATARDVFDAARRLGAPDVELGALGSMWRGATRVSLVLDVLPTLLRSAHADDVLSALAQEFPLWKDARKTVKAVAPDLDVLAARKMLDLCAAYPPAALAATLLGACPLAVATALIAETVARIGTLCTPEEIAGACEAWSGNEALSADARALARAVADASRHVDAVPASRPSGSRVRFDTDDHAIVVAKYRMKTPPRKMVAIDPAVRLQLPRHNTPMRFEVLPDRLCDAGEPLPERVLVRVSAGRDAVMEKPLWEACFDLPVDAAGEPVRPSVPRDDADFAAFQDLVRRTRRDLYFRFDIRFGDAGIAWM